MCGSGTLVIEAAMIAANVAPGARRHYFGFFGWVGHDRAAWDAVKRDALAREQKPSPADCAASMRMRPCSARRATTRRAPAWASSSLSNAAGSPMRSPRARARDSSPPIRLMACVSKTATRARALMKQLGGVLRENFSGWDAAMLAGSPDAGLELGIRAERVHTLWNGALECRLLRLHVSAETEKQMLHTGPWRAHRRSRWRIHPARRCSATASPRTSSSSRAGRSARGVSCYRLYDADMPEYSFAIDRYAESDGAHAWLYVQEYAAPKTIEPEAVQRRRNEALAALPGVTGIPVERIHLRQRRRTTRGDQYEKLGESADFKLVAEGGLRFWVNFTDYLDTGLFLDHRLTRATAARGCGAPPIPQPVRLHRQRHGVRRRRRRARNHDRGHVGHLPRLGSAQSGSERLFGARTRVHPGRLHRLARDGGRRAPACYDLIFLDPPTFSNSKRMDDILDVQRDHAA